MILQNSIFADTAEDNEYIIKNMIVEEYKKTLKLRRKDETEIFVDVGRHACVSEGDKVLYKNRRLDLYLKDGSTVQIAPKFEYSADIWFGNKRHLLYVREIDNQNDYDQYCSLRQFHYLSNKSLSEKDASYTQARSSHVNDAGRHIVLYAELIIDGKTHSAGYVDIGSSLLIHPVRLKIFKRDYHDPEIDLKMTFENNTDNTQVSNRTCRMRRVVIHPDFRSIGLTKHVLAAAKVFAKHSYVFGGCRSSFFESSAAMFNYLPFVYRAKMHFGGFSMGNQHEVIEHLRKSIYEIEHGIENKTVMAVQNRIRATRRFMDYCEHAGITHEDGIKIVQKYIDDDTADFHVSQWAMLRSIMRSVKPYFICGLTEYADEYIKTGISELTHSDKEIAYRDKLTSNVYTQSERVVNVHYRQLSVRAKYELPKDAITESLLNSFGLVGDAVYANILDQIHFTAQSGDVILIVGGSGCGKSMLLDCLDTSHKLHDNLNVNYFADRDYTCARPREFRPLDMPFNVLAREYSPEAVFNAFSRMGLAEAFILIKPFWMLSRGQQYRVMLADLLLRDDDVWIIDEFCADLDELTAQVVSMNLHKQIKRTKRIAIVAAANHKHYIDALEPTKIAVLRHGEKIKWRS